MAPKGLLRQAIHLVGGTKPLITSHEMLAGKSSAWWGCGRCDRGNRL